MMKRRDAHADTVMTSAEAAHARLQSCGASNIATDLAVTSVMHQLQLWDRIQLSTSLVWLYVTVKDSRDIEA